MIEIVKGETKTIKDRIYDIEILLTGFRQVTKTLNNYIDSVEYSIKKIKEEIK